MGNIDMPIMITMLAIGRMISNQDMGFIPSRMGHGMRGNLKMEGSMGKARWFLRPRGTIRLLNMLGIGRVTSLMVRVRPITKMGIIMRELSIKGNAVGMVCLRSIRLIGMRENGRMDLFMGMANYLDQGSYSLRVGLIMG